MISTFSELARARQREYEVLAKRQERRHTLSAYRRTDGTVQILRLRRNRRPA